MLNGDECARGRLAYACGEKIVPLQDGERNMGSCEPLRPVAYDVDTQIENCLRNL